MGETTDPEALNAQAMQLLGAGDVAAARRALERATTSAPRVPQYWFHLALACRGAADRTAERAALERVLQLDPDFYLALLQKAVLLELEGQPRKAAPCYNAFLQAAPAAVLASPAMAQAVARARSALDRDARGLEAFLANQLAAVRARHADQPLQRVDHTLDILTGRRRVFHSQSTFMQVPYLPAVQFYDRSLFPWLAQLEAATSIIRDELLAMLASDSAGLVPYVNYADGIPLNQWATLNRSLKWSAYFLVQNATAVPEHQAHFPATTKLLAGLPLAQIPGNAPTVFFSLLEPHTHIPPHTGVSNARLVVHLPLIVPPACRFRVGSESHEWEEGKAWVFDDTIEHEAWNDSDQPRVVLIVDTWNPLLTPAERELIAAATVAYARFRDAQAHG